MVASTTNTLMVTGCARCGQTHEIEFMPFAKNAIEVYGQISTHWGMCRNLNEPVLMRIEDCGENVIMKWQPWKDYEETYGDRDKPMPIPGPPCARCEYWQPRRDYMDIGEPYGKVFDGVTLCVAYADHGIEMYTSFSCFSPRDEE